VSASGSHAAALAIIALAFAKAWLVGWRFMELDHAPHWLRWMFSGWVAAAGSTLAVIVSGAAG
jgi:hypothetical protein